MAKRVRTKLCTSSNGKIDYTTDGKFIYAEKEGVTLRLDMFADHYYKLRPYNGGIILEIDGLRMQLVRDFKTPLEYSKEVVKGLGIPQIGKFIVLDTCMGLGYTAIAAAEKNSVTTVVTCEISQAVVALAQWNPYSEPLFAKDGKIVILNGSAAELIKKFDLSMFSFIIHDPPRISHAPELYSIDFYRELFRICKKGGKIFHYFGSVGSGKGRHIEQEVTKRLSQAGFKSIHYVPRLQGVYAVK